MAGYPPVTVWVRYTWDTAAAASLAAPALGPDFTAVEVGFEAREMVTRVVIDAYAADPIWTAMMDDIRVRMTDRIRETLGAPESTYVAVRTRSGVLAGVSGVAVNHPTGQNLLTGLCVLPVLQRQGLGTALLHASLIALDSLGVQKSVVFTEKGSIADLHVYRQFGSTRIEGVDYPGASS